MPAERKEHPVSSFVVQDVLEHDHHELDAAFALFFAGLGRGEWLSEPLVRASEGLRHHIFVEEESLFPILREAGLIGPVFVMLREHGEIWQALDQIEACAGGDFARAQAAFGVMRSVLEPHNSKEEQILYPASGQVLDAAATETVRVAFEEGKRPEGWLPQALRQGR